MKGAVFMQSERMELGRFRNLPAEAKVLGLDAAVVLKLDYGPIDAGVSMSWEEAAKLAQLLARMAYEVRQNVCKNDAGALSVDCGSVE